MRYIFLFVLLLLAPNVNSQSWVGLGLGANFNQVNFSNSDDVSDNNLKGTPGTTLTAYYQLGLSSGKGYNKKQASNIIGFEVGYKSIIFKDNTNSLLTTWNMQYLTASVVYRYNSRSKHRTNPFFGGGFVTDYLLSGTQNRGFNQYDLEEHLEPINLSVTAEIGLSYDVSEEVYATIGLAYLRGLTNVEQDPGQKALIHGWRLSIALFFELTNNHKRKR